MENPAVSRNHGEERERRRTNQESGKSEARSGNSQAQPGARRDPKPKIHLKRAMLSRIRATRRPQGDRKFHGKAPAGT